MTPFAFAFMTLSMLIVTGLAGYCMYRILNSGKPASEVGAEESDRR